MTDKPFDPQPGEWFCGECERITDDAIELDLEQCLQCGEPLSYELDELPDCVWRDAETPFADNH